MDIFENLCRTCGNECLESLNIYEVSVKALDKMVPIAEMLSSCLPANFPDLAPFDKYPKQICRICLKMLTQAYEFNHHWVGAHTEFNVAIKFEERRRRSLASKAQDVKVETLPKLQEIPKVAVGATLPAAAVEPIKFGTVTPTGVVKPNCKCTICGEPFLTEKATNFHIQFCHKVTGE